MPETFSGKKLQHSLKKMEKKFVYSHWLAVPIILLCAVLAIGWQATVYLGDKAREEIFKEAETSKFTITIFVTAKLKPFENAVQALSGSPWISPAIISGRDEDIANANTVLDRYNLALNASVTYLMNGDGLTIASSNRNETVSFVGKSYKFRPYFQEAIKGAPSRYFALGITSGLRGFYASHPVKDRHGNIVGVVAMKKDLDEIETFFKNYNYCFFVDQHGIIFLSSKPDMLFKSLWPIGKESQESLLVSKQFGDKPFSPVFLKELIEGEEVSLGEETFLVSRNFVGINGWSVVLMTSTSRVKAYKAIGIISTALMFLVVSSFFGIIYFVDKSKRIISQSEYRFRELFNSMKSGVAVYEAIDGGNDFIIKDLNQSSQTMNCVSREMAIGKSVLKIFPEVKEAGLFDVFKSVLEKGVPIHHPVSRFKDGRVDMWKENYVYRLPSGELVAICDDITEQKKMEEEIRLLSVMDTLTGLFNRRGFIALAEQQIKMANRINKQIVLFFIDLDGMKIVNDNFGHEEGDRLLVNSSNILKQTFRESDIIARIGGDEFTVLATDVGAGQEIVLSRLYEKLAIYNAAPDKRYEISMSIGFAVYDPATPCSLDELMTRADKLMYEQKKKKL